MQWKHKGAPYSQEISDATVSRKEHGTSFCDSGGVMFLEFMPHKTTLTGDTHASTMVAFRERISNNRLRMSSTHSPTIPSRAYVTTHSPTLSSLHLRHSSFSNPSVASPTSQLILEPFRCFTYVTSSSLTSYGEPPVVLIVIVIVTVILRTKSSCVNIMFHGECQLWLAGPRAAVCRPQWTGKVLCLSFV